MAETGERWRGVARDARGLVDASLLEAFSEIAGAAGQLLLDMYTVAPLLVEYKGPGDPVTAADRRANGLIVDRLNQALPGIPVVAEESAPASLIPCDGTCALRGPA